MREGRKWKVAEIKGRLDGGELIEREKGSEGREVRGEGRKKERRDRTERERERM